MKICSIDGCDNPIKSRNLCGKHYTRDRKHNDTGINYKFRINRLFLNDISSYIPTLTSPYERRVLQELFCMGRHQGTLKVNYNEAWSEEGHWSAYDI